jgi:ribonuclease P protein component
VAVAAPSRLSATFAHGFLVTGVPVTSDVQQSGGPALNATKDTPVASAHRFPKARRVRRRSEFQQIFQRGSRIHGRFFTVVMLSNGHTAPRLGIVASRRFGHAVDRNRAKRLIREIFRHLDADHGLGLDLVVIPRRELLDAGLPVVAQDFRNIWRRAVGRRSSAVR